MTESEIRELVDSYPDVDFAGMPIELLIEMSDRYLRAERQKLWERDMPKSWQRTESEAVIADGLRRESLARRQRERAAERVATEHYAVASAVANRISEITRDAAAKIVTEWAPTLLSSTFALPDGTRVTWATARVEHHELRAEWLEKNAASTVETAAIHRRAVRDIREAGASTLADLQEAAA